MPDDLDLRKLRYRAARCRPARNTRRASTELTPDRVETFAAQGVTRLVINVVTTDPVEQRDEMSTFADRFRLADGAG